jgi:hypothetical protein
MKIKKKTHSTRAELKIHGKKHEKGESAKFEKKEKKMPGYKDKD